MRREEDGTPCVCVCVCVATEPCCHPLETLSVGGTIYALIIRVLFVHPTETDRTALLQGTVVLQQGGQRGLLPPPPPLQKEKAASE